MAKEIKVTFVDGAVYDGFASTLTRGGVTTYYFSADLDYRVEVESNDGTPTLQQYRVRNGAWVDISIISQVELLEFSGTGITEEQAKSLFVLKAGDTMTGNLVVGSGTGKRCIISTNGTISTRNSNNKTTATFGTSSLSADDEYGYGVFRDKDGNSNVYISAVPSVSGSSSNCGRIILYNSAHRVMDFLGSTSSAWFYNNTDDNKRVVIYPNSIVGNGTKGYSFQLSVDNTSGYGNITLYNGVEGRRAYDVSVSNGYPSMHFYNTSGGLRTLINSVALSYLDDNFNTRVSVGRYDTDTNNNGYVMTNAQTGGYMTMEGRVLKVFGGDGEISVNNGSLRVNAFNDVSVIGQTGYALLKGGTSAVVEGANGVTLSQIYDQSDVFKRIEFTYNWSVYGSAYAKELSNLWTYALDTSSNIATHVGGTFSGVGRDFSKTLADTSRYHYTSNGTANMFTLALVLIYIRKAGLTTKTFGEVMGVTASAIREKIDELYQLENVNTLVSILETLGI